MPFIWFKTTPYQIFFHLKLYFQFYGKFSFFENEQNKTKKTILTANNNLKKKIVVAGMTNEKKFKVLKFQGGAAKIAEMPAG